MGTRVTKFLKGECEIHGETNFYIYKEEAHKCVECTKKKSKEWRLKNLKYVKQYSIKYNKKNKQKIKSLRDIRNEISRRKTIENHEDFYKKFGDYINDVASRIHLESIPRSIKHIKDPTEDKIFNFLIKAKRAQLRSYQIFRISSYVKWQHLKSLNLRSATEKQKSIIREEYKRKAKEIVDIEIEKILQNFNKNK
jgi:carboxypeptidase C (cathepsin A)